MAYPILVGSIAQVTFRGVHDGQEILTVLNYKVDAPATLTDGKAAIVSLNTNLTTPGNLFEQWQNCMSEQVSDMSVKTQWVFENRFAYVKVVPFINVGAVAGPSFPSNLAVAITRQTDNAGQQNVGTIHMGGIPLTFLLEGQVNAVGRPLYETFAAGSIQDIAAGGVGTIFRPIHFHRSSPGIALPLTGFVVQSSARTMHRRTVGLGS